MLKFIMNMKLRGNVRGIRNLVGYKKKREKKMKVKIKRESLK